MAVRVLATVSATTARFVLAANVLAADGPVQQAAAAQFWVVQAFSEGAGDALLVAECDPVTKGGGLVVSVLGSVGLAGELESRFKISLERCLGHRHTSHQGLCCGHCEAK